jgi:hypothetical protein
MTIELDEEERKALVRIGKWLSVAALPLDDDDFRQAAAIVVVRVLPKVKRRRR